MQRDSMMSQRGVGGCACALGAEIGTPLKQERGEKSASVNSAGNGEQASKSASRCRLLLAEVN